MISFSAPVRIRNNGNNKASRHFISVPRHISHEIKSTQAHLPRKGRGSIKVQVRIGFVSRETSIFPDKKSDTYLLPLKKDIRTQLNIGEGDKIGIELTLI